MKITYRSKQESKAGQEARFLALSPSERVFAFFRLMDQMQHVPTLAKGEDKGIFLLKSRCRKNETVERDD